MVTTQQAGYLIRMLTRTAPGVETHRDTLTEALARAEDHMMDTLRSEKPSAYIYRRDTMELVEEFPPIPPFPSRGSQSGCAADLDDDAIVRIRGQEAATEEMVEAGRTCGE